MDNTIIWVPIITIIGTLAGVWLGNWLQSRNIRQQRQWMLQDQKREWKRRQRQEEFEKILTFVEGTLECVLKEWGTSDIISQERKEEIFLKYKEQTASAMPIIYTIMGEDEELAILLVEFEQKKNEAFDAISANDYPKWDSSGKRISELAGLIKKQIKKLLEETFD